MTKITITRHYSGFTNVADTFSVGNDEHQGRTSVSDYTLPDGYKLDPGFAVIRDPDGYECAIVPHSSGKPQLISRAGKISAQPVLTEEAV